MSNFGPRLAPTRVSVQRATLETGVAILKTYEKLAKFLGITFP